MTTFNSDHFTRRLIAETLFYDEEYGALGNLSLIDTAATKERFIASYAPEDGVFVIEEAIAWEEYVPDEEDDIGYALAVDSNEYSTHESPDEAASALFELARNHQLVPSITLLFEEDDA